MIPSPRRAVSTPAVSTWPDFEDDDGWQDMPVVRSDDNPFGLDEEDQKRYHYRPPARLDDSAGPSDHGAAGAGNATGTHLELEADTLITDSWREKAAQDESDYTRLRLDEDEESEEVHMRTRYLFDEDKAMTPLSQMQATKELLTEGQRIAYVGLCQLIMRRMLRDMGRGWEGYKAKNKLGVKSKGKHEVPVVENGHIWMLKIMARLYQHMELAKEEQRMIESLAEHGVDPSDLVPALMTTHTVNNPDFDPKAKEKADMDAAAVKEAEADEEAERELQAEKDRLREDDAVSNAGTETAGEAPPPPYEPRERAESLASVSSGKASPALSLPPRKINPFGDDEDEDDLPTPLPLPKSPLSTKSIISPPSPLPDKKSNPFGDDEDDSLPAPSSSKAKSPSPRPAPPRLPSFNDDDGGDIGSALSPPLTQHSQSPFAEKPAPLSQSPVTTSPVTLQGEKLPGSAQQGEQGEGAVDPEKTPKGENTVLFDEDDPNAPASLPALPGVSTSLSNTDEMVTLDIRWTVLCDLFLVLIADSVFDARSRAFLKHVAAALGFGWLDVVRFENRVTEALEIQESVEKTGQNAIIEGRRKAARNKRYAMMGLAAVGGGLVIGLSAGLMAPFIGAGLGTAFATVGITGTSGFLAGAGGAAIITTGGVLTGANIAGQGMAKRTREVRTFELRPLHNNKRVNCYITVGGFMASKVDDVRLPFSVIDPIVGDVFSVLWEPDMMAEMGSALKILTGEILTQVGQQVLQATVMTALLSALQWPIILTKLGYLIDNPWSNALDRARAAGLVLADLIIQRHAGVRPISLIGFSLGARAIFYALVELARQKAYGLVEDVFIFGTTVTASRATWLDVRSVVAGRFVNGYATNDWMLGYLFRATSGGLNTVAGLRPVETVQGLENVDVTEIITGHMSYRSCMPQLLAKVGFPVTADYFDEPDDPEMDMNIQERTIVNEAEEEAKKNRKKILGIFPARSSTSASGSSTPNPEKKSGTSTPANAAEYELDDDELPPREEEADLGDLSGGALTEPKTEEEKAALKEAVAKAQKEHEEAMRKEAEAVKAIPATAGFDFQAISKELGKEIDVDKLKQPEARRPNPLPSIAALESRAPLERSGSAPPPVAIQVSPPLPDDAAWAGPSAGVGSARSASASRFASDGGEDDGDIAATKVRQMSLADMPSWDSPAPLQVPTPPKADVSPPLSAGGGFKTAFSWNAWGSGSTTPEPKAPRQAPPARPHPVELLNAWGDSGSGGGFGPGGFDVDIEKKRKDDEKMAEENPW
ncbi:hypothetical protein IAT38_000825 [Cryptococcus sp. DSM 104549]